MKNVALITDSSACLPPESIKQYDITVVPMRIIVGEQSTMTVSISPPERSITFNAPAVFCPPHLHHRPGNSSKHIKPPARNQTPFIRAKEMAKATLPETEIEVFDARTAAGAHGLLVLAAARVIASGGSLHDTVREIERLLPKISLVAAVDTLYFLAKGGRIPRAQAWVGSLLSIKPILQVVDGEAFPLERIRTKPKATKRLIEIMQERSGRSAMHVNIMHAGVSQEAEEIRQQVAAQFDCAELHVTEFTPVMGAHTGPGLVGLAFYSDG